MNNPLISIIIPVYNVEAYLRRCLDSVINQIYENLEIILIDDGSTDNSEIICDEYKEKDKRIITLHKPNGGLSSARNAGLDVCKGEYIAFVDSDDSIENNFISHLYDIAIANNADLAVCSLRLFCCTGYVKQILCFENKIFTGADFIEKFHECYCFNKLYKRNLLINKRFKIGATFEDVYFYYDVVYCAGRVVTCSDFLYNYIERTDSILRKSKNILCPDRLDAEYFAINFIIDKKINKSAVNHIFRQAWSYYVRSLSDLNSNYKSICKNKYKQIVKVCFKKLTYKNKLAAKFPHLSFFVWKFLKKIK